MIRATAAMKRQRLTARWCQACPQPRGNAKQNLQGAPPIPHQFLEIVFDRVKGVVFRHRFGRNCRHVDGDADVLMLEPVGR